MVEYNNFQNNHILAYTLITRPCKYWSASTWLKYLHYLHNCSNRLKLASHCSHNFSIGLKILKNLNHANITNNINNASFTFITRNTCIKHANNVSSYSHCLHNSNFWVLPRIGLALFKYIHFYLSNRLTLFT